MKYNSPIITTLILISFSLSGSLFAQQNRYPDDYFQPPIEGQIYLSGTFGELRSNHFHSGIDIKTGGVEGKNIFAIADGYVSRIRVSTGGYGKVLYITHPNGYVSVYGHLQKFNDTIQQFVKEFQYKEERFAVQIFPKKAEIKVKKGEVIAYSGNTGGSSAPHLHFEIRIDSSQHPVNPLLFKSISIKDFYKPKILELGIYPVDETSFINGKNDTAFFMVEGWGEEHYLDGKPEITVSGKVSFGVRTYDAMNDVANKNGIYELDFYVDSVKTFGIVMNELSFSTKRYINSLIDFNYYKKKKRRLIRTQIDTNNRLANYKDVFSNGIFDFSDSLFHSIQYHVKDIYGNTSKLSFKVQSVHADSTVEIADGFEKTGQLFNYARENKYSSGNINLSFPPNSFYRSFYFQFDTVAGDSELLAPIYQVHNKYTPVQKSFSISIKPDSVPAGLKDKMFIAVMGNNGKGWYLGSKWEGDKMVAKSRSFGNYSIMMDTILPDIDPVNVFNGKDISKQTTIKVKIRDRETGISYFRGTLNDEWILMEYEPKKSLLFYYFDERLKKGGNNLKVIVKDKLGNESVYEANLIYTN